MKKIYIAPIIELEEIETEDIIAASPSAAGDYLFGGGGGGSTDQRNGDTNSTGENENDDDWTVGAKGSNYTSWNCWDE